MNTAHLHLMLNHLPLTGTLVGMSLLAIGLLRRPTSRDLTAAGLVALVVTAALGVLTYLTGASAEAVVEQLPGVTEAMIERHEEVAEAAMFAIGATGLVALTALLLQSVRPRDSRMFALTVLALAVLSFGITGWVANLGGHIRHSEIRSAASVTPGATAETPARADDD